MCYLLPYFLDIARLASRLVSFQKKKTFARPTESKPFMKKIEKIGNNRPILVFPIQLLLRPRNFHFFFIKASASNNKGLVSQLSVFPSIRVNLFASEAHKISTYDFLFSRLQLT